MASEERRPSHIASALARCLKRLQGSCSAFGMTRLSLDVAASVASARSAGCYYIVAKSSEAVRAWAIMAFVITLKLAPSWQRNQPFNHDSMQRQEGIN